MSEENAVLKEVKEQIISVHESFKKINDEAITLEQVKNHVDPLVKGQVDTLSSKLDELEATYEKEIAKLKQGSGFSAKQDEEKLLKAKELYSKYFKKGVSSMSHEEHSEFLELTKGINQKFNFSGNDADGGFVVRPDFSNRINQDVKEDSPIRQIAETITIGTNEYVDYYDESDVGAGWVGETASRPKTSSPSLNELRIPVCEMYASPEATQNLIDDSFIDIEGWLQGKLVSKFARLEGSAFVSGDGSKKPKGFLSYNSGSTFNKLQQVTTAGSGVIAFDDLISVTDSLLDSFKTNARWVMNKETRSALRKLKDGENQYLWQPDNQGGIAASLLGYAVTIAVDMPAIGTNNLAVAFGDFRRGYKIVDRQGLRILRDPFTNKPFIKYYTTKRVGGGVQHFQAIKILKVSS